MKREEIIPTESDDNRAWEIWGDNKTEIAERKDTRKKLETYIEKYGRISRDLTIGDLGTNDVAYVFLESGTIYKFSRPTERPDSLQIADVSNGDDQAKAFDVIDYEKNGPIAEVGKSFIQHDPGSTTPSVVIQSSQIIRICIIHLNKSFDEEITAPLDMSKISKD